MIIVDASSVFREYSNVQIIASSLESLIELDAIPRMRVVIGGFVPKTLMGMRILKAKLPGLEVIPSYCFDYINGYVEYDMSKIHDYFNGEYRSSSTLIIAPDDGRVITNLNTNHLPVVPIDLTSEAMYLRGYHVFLDLNKSIGS